jgi:tRNA modification GTPase
VSLSEQSPWRGQPENQLYPTFGDREKGKTVAAALTSTATAGAIGVVAVHGPNAYAVVSDCFRPATDLSRRPLQLNQIRFGHWQSNESIVVVPTDAMTIEIHCHGGVAAVQAILLDLQRAGVSLTDAQDWAKCCGYPDDKVAMEFILSRTNTERTARIALDQWNGALSLWAERVLQIGDGDMQDGWQTIKQEITSLQRFEKLGAHLIEPWQVVIAGPPNVGKSSLLNRLLGYQRVIAHDQPGTTRDVIAATTAVAGWPVRFSDTAGLRASADPLESEGVQRAVNSLATADLVLIVVDSHRGWEQAHEQLLNEITCPSLQLWNKSDLVPPRLSAPDALAVSAVTGDGLQQACESIAEKLVPEAPPCGHPVPITRLQSDILKNAMLADSELACRKALSILKTHQKMGQTV